ncbi:hypothetical protein QAD02_009714 [Eretmocerus hayati]|uniref:Uncharacterized protein n=4 Tax=Eretmocerus hayati TaxID=131215 RepID=A0ACC2NA51_9HYME|nr:hypothetical protein QAD02_009711 [Eretmocerus hayati]KAJ8668049.1 hypothetical protein QAD02_009712 [Eretmocerus hayati]KAJ8668050.1 hypothetical protein QAD02_009713 [Eretmocerus hayati]KAJ8668051.1 hypothetical protein QAD02_009714 [Eretmocerus hayati]
MNRINNLEYKRRNRSFTDEYLRSQKFIQLQDARAARQSKKSIKNVSRSERKIAAFQSAVNQKYATDLDLSVTSEYLIIHKDQLPELVKDQFCVICKKKEMTVTVSGSLGFAKKLSVTCKSCTSNSIDIYSCKRDSPSKPFNINKKVVEAMLLMGLGYAGLQKLCLTIDLNIMSRATFNSIMHQLSTEYQVFKTQVLELSRKIVRELYLSMNPHLRNDEILDYSVAYDGTYQKRGFISLYGVCIVTELFTGLVIDFEVLSKYCKICSMKSNALGQNSPEFQEWYGTHEADCQKNFSGSSKAMESKGAEIICSRSEKECGARFTTVLCDGDNETVKRLNDLQVYGPNVEVSKEECINHVSKRLVKGLKTLRKDWSSKGVTLGGRKSGALTDHVIDKLASFYRNAIVENIPHVNLMKSAILATLSHYKSKDSAPTHHLCPQGKNSWCWYNKAKAHGKKPPRHSTHPPLINRVVIEKVRSVYERLSSTELLERCIRGGTQNSNESLHNTIWNHCPKERFQSSERLNMAVITAVSEFNMGCEISTRLKRNIQGQGISETALSISSERDKQRLHVSKNMVEATKRRGLRKRKAKQKSMEARKSNKGSSNVNLYEPGGY